VNVCFVEERCLAIGKKHHLFAFFAGGIIHLHDRGTYIVGPGVRRYKYMYMCMLLHSVQLTSVGEESERKHREKKIVVCANTFI